MQDVQRRIIRSATTGEVIDDCEPDNVPDKLLHSVMANEDDIRVELILKGAQDLYKIVGPDVVEMYSQPRVVQEAAMREYDGIRLTPGWSLDLTLNDPETGRPWDFNLHSVRERVREMIRDTKPFLVICSPPMHDVLFSAKPIKEQTRSGTVGKEHEGRRATHQVLCGNLQNADCWAKVFHA